MNWKRGGFGAAELSLALLVEYFSLISGILMESLTRLLAMFGHEHQLCFYVIVGVFIVVVTNPEL